MNDRRTRLHIALDAVLDRAGTKDAFSLYESELDFKTGDTVSRGGEGHYKVLQVNPNGSVEIRPFIRKNGTEYWDGGRSILPFEKAKREVKRV